MKRNLTCIICPKGCSLCVDTDAMTVTGNSCPRGETYGIEECTHPVRTVTSVLRVAQRDGIMVSVKTSVPVPKEQIAEVMETIRAHRAAPPIRIGDVLIPNVCGADIIATKSIK